MLGKKAGSVINLMFVFYYRVLGIGKTIFFIYPLLLNSEIELQISYENQLGSINHLLKRFKFVFHQMLVAMEYLNYITELTNEQMFFGKMLKFQSIFYQCLWIHFTIG